MKSVIVSLTTYKQIFLKFNTDNTDLSPLGGAINKTDKNFGVYSIKIKIYYNNKKLARYLSSQNFHNGNVKK